MSDNGDPSGNGGGHRRRRADNPSKFDRGVKRAVGTGEGCLVQSVGLFGLGVWIVSMAVNGVLRIRRNA